MTSQWTRRRVLAAGAAAALAQSLAAQESHPALPHPVRVGILGLDGHYSEVLEAAKLVPEIRVVAVTAPTEREKQRASSNPILASAKLYTDYVRMLDAEKLDVVAICDTNGQRAGSVQACAERGLAIAAEKPLAISFPDLEAIKRTIAHHHARLTMLLPMRFEPHYLAMKSLIASGAIGEPIALGAQKSYKLGPRPDWMKRRSTYGGTIPYIGIHMIDLMRWSSGREFVETAAFQSNVAFPAIGDMENNTALIFRLDNRGTANLRMDYLRPETAPTHGDDRLRIAGSKGVIEYQNGHLTLITTSEKPREITDLPHHAPLFADFVFSLYSHTPHMISLDDIYRVTGIVLRAREAADSNRILSL
ncbi:MAG TPA: Gfo/Idh/MocA family oxidoreductase [Bryobacterales bacterium]|nr:Gfo/Idh/MocA family oxidoreductase [Bryobacterales bacterium]